MKRKHPESGDAMRQGVRPPQQSSSTCVGCLFPSTLPASSHNSLGSQESSAAGSPYLNSKQSSLPEGERLLIQDMNNLTIEERERLYEEVHGVSTTGDQIEETPAFVESSLQAIQACLAKPSRRKFPEYDRAAFLVPQRVQDRSFLLKFLRRERFQAEPAALMVRRFFKFCFEWFGTNGLLRDIGLGDLSADDLDVLRTCFVHIPYASLKDRAGRPIMVFFSAQIKYKDPFSMVRILFFMYWKVLQDEVAQTKGVVSVTWAYGDHIPTFPPSVFAPCTAIYSAVPMNMSALHICYDQMALAPFIEITRLTVGRSLRIRMRTHFGSRLESRYSLLTFGIDANTFPINNDGEMDPSCFLKWLEEEKQTEEQQSRQTHPALPTSTDILLGRGQPFRKFLGNQELARLVDVYHPAFESSHKVGRRSIVDTVLNQLTEEQGRRVLKRNSPSEAWYVASRKEAAKKIDASFRNKKQVDQYHQDRLAGVGSPTEWVDDEVWDS